MIIENYNKVLYYNNINSINLNENLIEKNSTSLGDINLASKLVNSIQDNPECIIFSFEDV
jgi:hypothetical protein